MSEKDRKEVLLLAAERSGRPAYLLEKDVWVVWSLGALFGGTLGKHLVFKGGTSLSKAYNRLIRRFSEDIDLTYDIRQLLDVGDVKEEFIPENNSQATKWTNKVRKALPNWIANEVIPLLNEAIEKSGIELKLTQENEKLRLAYGQLTDGMDYVSPEVLLEFGARSTGQPADVMPVVCDAAEWLHEVDWPTANPIVMKAERTFWEKATAVHAYCKKGSARGERYARHWYDLVQLADGGIAKKAIADRYLSNQVANHKNIFFGERGSDGVMVDYLLAVDGKLKLVPDGQARKSLSEDYQEMRDSGLFEEEPWEFDVLMDKCQLIENEANGC